MAKIKPLKMRDHDKNHFCLCECCSGKDRGGGGVAWRQGTGCWLLASNWSSAVSIKQQHNLLDQRNLLVQARQPLGLQIGQSLR